MNPRKSQNRRAFRLESLEVRNAPSHLGGLAHVALTVHHAAAQVRHFSDSSSHDRVNSVDSSRGIEKSPDKGVETSNDPSGVDTSPRDRSIVDQSGES